MSARFLLDVNVLIALVDSAHVNHDAAHVWMAPGRDWATCPLTQNALVRILSNPAYPTVEATPSEVITTLSQLIGHPRHHAIAADVCLADRSLFAPEHIATAKTLTDTYLLGLAVKHGLALATFDRRIHAHGVVGATTGDICLVPA